MGYKLYSAGVQVAFRADPDSSGIGWLPLAQMNDVEDTDLIYTDIIFPECIAYGSTGSPRYQTEKVEVLSGNEQRQTRWAYPKHEYSINMENLPADEQADVMNIWHTVSGDFAAFLFLDPLDHTSQNSATLLSGSDITATDQPVGVATGALADYALYKYYTKASRQKQRRILYPKLDTLIVAVDGIAISDWVYSYSTNMLSFTAPIGSLAFTGTKVDGLITGSNFSALQAGSLVYLTGFANGSLNRPQGGNPLRVTAADGTSVTLTEYNGDPYTGSEASASLTLKSALPPSGGTITAGFYFYVPVRFDDGDNAESEIKAGMRESAITDFSNITLKEVFE